MVLVGSQVQRRDLSLDARRTAVEVIFHDPHGGLDRLAAQQPLTQRVRGHAGIGHRHVIALALAFGHVNRSQEGVLGVERAAAQIGAFLAFNNARLVVDNIRASARHDQATGVVEDPDGHVGARYSGSVVDVEDGRPLRSAGLLNPLVIDGELVPVDVTWPAHIAGHVERVAIDAQQISEVLVGRLGIVSAHAGPAAGRRTHEAQRDDQTAAVVWIIHGEVQRRRKRHQTVDCADHRTGLREGRINVNR